jgi:hypothetical protein
MGESSTGVGFGTRPSRETFNTSLGASNVSSALDADNSNYMYTRYLRYCYHQSASRCQLIYLGLFRGKLPII